MKNGIKLYLALFIAVLNFSGCNEEYKSSTKINRDGSCEKTITVKADSAYIQNGYFHIPFDSTWHPKFIKQEKDTQKVLLLRKSFADVNELNREYSGKNSAAVKIDFEKKFRWFFTYFSYKEIFKAYSPFKIIPLDSFLTRDELSKYTAGDTSKALKKRIDDYTTENIYEYFYQNLSEAAKRINDNSLTPELLEKNKRQMRDALIKDNVDEKQISDFILKIANKKEIPSLDLEIKKILDDINSKLSERDVRYQFTNEIIMPGIILSTNAGSVEGNMAEWKFPADRFQFLDYEMIVESRISNLWALYVTGGVVLIVLIILLFPKLKRA